MQANSIALVLVVLAIVSGLVSLSVMLQDVGSCPLNEPDCDHAYFIGGTYFWMRPIYIGFGIASLVLFLSALVFALYGRRRTTSNQI